MGRPGSKKAAAAETANGLRTSEDAIAERFAERHANDLRYVPKLMKWFVWDGGRWLPDDTLRARAWAWRFCHEAASEASDPRVRTALSSLRTVKAVERLARWDPRLAATIEEVGHGHGA